MPTMSNPSRLASSFSWSVRSPGPGSVAAVASGGSVLEAKVFIDLPGRVGLVERVEVDPPHLMIEQVTALLGGPVNANLGHGFVALAAFDRPEQGSREACTQRQLSHPNHTRLRRDGHDARDDRHGNPLELAALTEIVEVAIHEEELGADIVSAGVNLLFQVIHLLEPVRCLGMPLRKPGHADTKAARVAGDVQRLDEPYQLRGIAKRVVGPAVI